MSAWTLNAFLNYFKRRDENTFSRRKVLLKKNCIPFPEVAIPFISANKTPLIYRIQNVLAENIEHWIAD